MPRVVRTRLVLAVRDLDASTRYWIDVLGCKRDFGDGSDGWSFLSRDDFRVMLGECPDERAASELGNHSYVAYMTVDDVDGMYSELTERGAIISSPPESKPWGMREFGVRTPDGHRIGIASPTNS
jgi:catechol 2,3-dioxygenase-like lactoylglutathione lyase family enzyme